MNEKKKMNTQLGTPQSLEEACTRGLSFPRSEAKKVLITDVTDYVISKIASVLLADDEKDRHDLVEDFINALKQEARQALRSEGIEAITTSKGFRFECIGDGWKDCTSGLIWHQIEPVKYTFSEAMNAFPPHGAKRLPTINEFKEAEEHGIREVFSDFKGRRFWSASLYPGKSDFAFDFVGDNGLSYFGLRDSPYGSVRCVGR